MRTKDIVNVSNISNNNLLIGEVSNTAIRTYDGVKELNTVEHTKNTLLLNKKNHIKFIAELPVNENNVPIQNDMNVYIIINDEICIDVDTYKEIPKLHELSCFTSVLDNFEPFKSINIILRSGENKSSLTEYTRDSEEFEQCFNNDEIHYNLFMTKINKFYYKAYWTEASNKFKWSKLENSVEYVRYYELISLEEYNNNTELYQDFKAPSAFTTNELNICVNELNFNKDNEGTNIYVKSNIRIEETAIKLSSIRSDKNYIFPKNNYYIFDASTAYEVITFLLRFYVGKFNIAVPNILAQSNENYYINKIHVFDEAADKNYRTLTLLYLTFYNFKNVFLSDIRMAVKRTTDTHYIIEIVQTKDKTFNALSTDNTQEIVSSIEIEDDGVTNDFYVSKFKCDEIEKNTPYNNLLCIPSILTTDDSYTYFPVFSVIGRGLDIVLNPTEASSYIGFVHYASNNETSTEYSHLNSLSISESVVNDESDICIRLCSH